MRREFSAKVRVAAFQRADGRCEECGVALHPGKFAYDHVLPDALEGEPTLDNCRVLCDACHGVKTATQDIPRIRKADRQRKAHIGARPRPVRKIASAGFPKYAKPSRIGRHRIEKNPLPPKGGR